MAKSVARTARGKTTLLRTLDGIWGELHRRPIIYSPNDQGRLPAVRLNAAGRSTQIVVDGFEQLKIAARFSLLMRTRLNGCGLLVTTHQPVSFLTRVHTSKTSFETFAKIAEDRVGEQLSCSIVRQAYEGCNGNVREAFMQLYDSMRDEHLSSHSPQESGVRRSGSN